METTITFDDGASTTLESWGSTGAAIVCVHGITSSRKAWERTARVLSQTHRVFAYDQRGHGDSASVAGPMTLERSLADLRAVCEYAGAPVSLIGHSWGGAVAVLGGREPFADKVVAIDPMIRVMPGSWRSDYLDDTERDLAQTPGALEAGLRKRLSSWHEIDVAGKLHAVRGMKAQTVALLGTENGVDDGEWDLRSTVAAYPKPLLVLLAGPADSVVSSEDLAFLQSQGGANVTVERLADQGHNLHRTAFERYIELTKPFLS